MKRIYLSLASTVCAMVVMTMYSCSDNPEKRLAHYKDIVHELSSDTYQGRGYAKDGVRLAGNYIAKEFEKSGVKDVQRQGFDIDINTFPGNMVAEVDGRALTAGRDFVLREFSPGVNGDYNLVYADTADFNVDRLLKEIDMKFDELGNDALDGFFVVADFWFSRRHGAEFERLQTPEGPVAGIIYTWNEPLLKFYKAYGETVHPKPIIWTTREAIADAKTIHLDIDNSFFYDYKSDNVIAHIKGRNSDSCFVFTAHYDHLGNLGRDVYYPGANDNASGTAAIITLAAYYAKHRPQYDMWFIAFSGEDANLRGSTYFAQNPTMPLEQIRYLINIDMIGDNNPVQYCEVSEAGMPLYPLWEKLNGELRCFASLHRGPLAANSDHYPFAERGVPTIFLENEGGDAFPLYHTIDDDWNHAIFTSYEPVFRLVTAFVDTLTGGRPCRSNRVIE